jgi:excisionase family DNA binding protein
VSETPIHNLLTVKETAEYLRIPLPTVYYLVQRGRIPAIQIGGRWRIKKSAAQSTVPRKGPRQLRETIPRWLGRQAVQDRLLQIAEARRTISPPMRMWFLRRDVQQPPGRRVEGAAFHFRHPTGYECGPPSQKARFSSFHGITRGGHGSLPAFPFWCCSSLSRESTNGKAPR